MSSVHLLDWPQRNPVFAQDDLFAKHQDIFEELKTIISLVPEANENWKKYAVKVKSAVPLTRK